MNQDLIVTNQESTALAQVQQSSFPLRSQMPSTVNAGAVLVEQERAIAEVKGQIQIAKLFPRNIFEVEKAVIEACRHPAMASIAFYTLPQGGQKITGPSIKLMEQIASLMGNMEWGHRELSRTEAGPGPRDFGRSEIEVFAWDKETNIRSIRQITVLHTIDTREGPRKLRDQREIDNRIANVAAKQVRGRLQAIIYKWLVEVATEECRKTLAGANLAPLRERIAKMVDAFAKLGVTKAMIENYLGHEVEKMDSDEIVDMTGVFNAIKDGTPVEELFGPGVEQQSPAKADDKAESLQATAKQASKAASGKQPKATKDSNLVKEESNQKEESPQDNQETSGSANQEGETEYF